MDDALSHLLSDVRTRGALFDQSVLQPPWSLRFDEGLPVSLLSMLSGEAWLTAAGAPSPVPLHTGDIVVVVGPEPYTVADSRATTPRADVHRAAPGGTSLHDLTLPLGDGPGDPAGTPVLLKATYQVHGSVSRRVLNALPRVARVPALPECRPIMGMISTEIARHSPGRQVMFDRMLDLLLVSSLREWFELPGSAAPSWYRAHHDPLIGQALRLIHDSPGRPWTVADLAAEVGASRARFAQRFTELVGQPPMTYLAQWRISLAADLLACSDATVEAVARRVGYANAYALSVAFKRTLGVRPGEHRSLARAR
ncbi:AraC family transcriptional regulator [Streptomyces avicenniae]|uniref:AraC family transcriptional regulator n=1 Tax=Streptomyces avicenniae TaxID=500153 RepID=UPI000699F16D|nr:AraC family transcriptional regulator [Streptomyces avicenniae]